ncbi:leucine-rich_repeat domain-containing protein [Hexamita inflata]|uniref:Leucine-rich_repeat domain-containing protein n=1 Tax=Hexamita inflata TaxID=28002 RepID=A0ABP1JG31_9EUKA
MTKLSDYDQKMILQYKSKVVDRALKIYENSELSSLQFLKQLDLVFLQIWRSAVCLQELPANVMSLVISNCSHEKLSQISEYNHLSTFFALNCNLKDISSISSAIFLVKLNMSGNLFTDTTPLSTLTRLNDLTLMQNKIENASPLQSLVNLVHLDLSVNAVLDVSFVLRMKKLKVLKLRKNKISFARFLLRMELEVDLGANCIQDVQDYGKKEWIIDGQREPIKDLIYFKLKAVHSSQELICKNQRLQIVEKKNGMKKQILQIIDEAQKMNLKFLEKVAKQFMLVGDASQ